VDVLADLKGPGYVSRFWTTGETNGLHPLRFYFDGERSPRIDTSPDACAGNGRLTPPPGGQRAFCWYSWTPIPYRKRLIVMAGDAGTQPGGPTKLFYQIAYNALPAVESFPRALSATDSNAWKTRVKVWLHLTTQRAKAATKPEEPRISRMTRMVMGNPCYPCHPWSNLRRKGVR